MQERSLKTQQVADALGISVSTLKRWVDAGQLPATRTIGKHRLISLDEAIRFARRNNLTTSGLEGLWGSELDAPVAGVVERERLIEALKAGRAVEARRLIRSAHASLGGGAALADELIGPAMRAVGHRWSVGSWDVFEEHQASQIVGSSIADLIARAGSGGDAPAPIALGASPEGDRYTLATLLGELTLREAGWDVRNLGPDLPLRSLSRAVAAFRPRLVFLAVSHLHDPIGFVGSYDEFRRAASAEGAAVILGGRGLSPEVRARLGGAEFGDRMADLAEFGRGLLAAQSTRINGPCPTNRQGPDPTSTN